MEELVDERGAVARLEEVTDALGSVVLKITGELDISNVGSIQAAIQATYGQGLDLIVFDLSEVSFMDSSGLAMLLALAERIGTVELRNPSGLVRRVIELTGVSGVFRITKIDLSQDA